MNEAFSMEEWSVFVVKKHLKEGFEYTDEGSEENWCQLER